MQTWSCFIPGSPVGRAEKRVTFTIRGKDGQSRQINKLADKDKQSSYKSYFRTFIADRRPAELLDGPLQLTIWVYRERPKSLPKRVSFPATRPDWTNYAKLLEDCLTGIVIRDDALVVTAVVHKRYSESPGVWIEVREIQQARASHDGFELIGETREPKRDTPAGGKAGG